MLLSDFSKLDHTQKENIEKIFLEAKEYLQNLANDNFPVAKAVDIPIYLGKIIAIIEENGFRENNIEELSSKLLAEIRNLNHNVNYNRGATQETADAELDLREQYLDLLVAVNTYFSKIRNNKTDNLNSAYLFGFYNPELSEKEKAINSIKNAIQLISTDPFLSEKAKKSIINLLEKAIESLHNPKSSKIEFFGYIKTAINILGSLGALTAGTVAVKNYVNAEMNLKDATEIVQQSSINYNINSINQIFINDETTFELLNTNFKQLLTPADHNKPNEK